MKFDINNNKNLTLKIGAHEVSVEFLDKTHPLFESKGDEYTWGHWDVDKRKISIRNDLTFSMFLSTLLHEVYHAFEDFYGVKVSHKDLNLVADLYSQVLLTNFAIEEKETKSKKNKK